MSRSDPYIVVNVVLLNIYNYDLSVCWIRYPIRWYTNHSIPCTPKRAHHCLHNHCVQMWNSLFVILLGQETCNPSNLYFIWFDLFLVTFVLVKCPIYMKNYIFFCISTWGTLSYQNCFNNILKKKSSSGRNMKQSESDQRGVRSETFLQIVLLIFIFWYFSQWKMFY